MASFTIMPFDVDSSSVLKKIMPNGAYAEEKIAVSQRNYYLLK